MADNVNVSTEFRLQLMRQRASGVRQYQIARAAHVDPSVASAIIIGAQPIKVNDARVVRLGRVLGLRPEQCFETVDEARRRG
jgi:plasmid maintenance system antidote protein VapI